MLWVTIIFLIIVVLGAFLLKARSKHEPAEYPYQKVETLFSPAERSFFGVLEKAVGDKYRVLGKIRLADMIFPRNGLSRSDWQKSFNRIVSKHVDFALCKKDDLSVVCAIELDDSSHKKSGRKDRDQFLGAARDILSARLFFQNRIPTGVRMERRRTTVDNKITSRMALFRRWGCCYVVKFLLAHKAI